MALMMVLRCCSVIPQEFFFVPLIQPTTLLYVNSCIVACCTVAPLSVCVSLANVTVVASYTIASSSCCSAAPPSIDCNVLACLLFVGIVVTLLTDLPRIIATAE